MNVCFQLVAMRLSSQRNLEPGATVSRLYVYMHTNMTKYAVPLYTLRNIFVVGKCIGLVAMATRACIRAPDALQWVQCWRARSSLGAYSIFTVRHTHTYVIWGCGMNNLLKIMECLIGKKCLEAFIINVYGCMCAMVRMLTYHTVARIVHMRCAHMLIYTFY